MHDRPWFHRLYVKSSVGKILWGIVSIVGATAVLLFIFVNEESRMQAQTMNWEGRSIEKGAALFSNNCTTCHAADGKGLPGVAPSLHSRYFFTQRIDDVGWAGSLEDYIELTLHAGRPSKLSTQWNAIMPTWGNRFGGPLRDDQIQALTDYVLNWEEDALAQTPETDPWLFFEDSLSKQLPYDPDEPGYEQKLQEALLTAQNVGLTSYTLGEEEFEIEQPEGIADAGPREPSDLFVSMACAGCHNLNENQTPRNQGQPGPHMGNLIDRAGDRVAGLDGAEYVYRSIVASNEYIVPGYPGVMPQNYADQMTEEEIRSLAAWLLDPNRMQ